MDVFLSEISDSFTFARQMSPCTYISGEARRILFIMFKTAMLRLLEEKYQFHHVGFHFSQRNYTCIFHVC